MKTPAPLRIGSRKSHLARYQAYRVGQALRTHAPTLKIEYFFKESLGDINLQDPLWKMPEKGVFTEDFVRDLEQGAVDIVVHSWKDLPTFPRPHTQIVATLARADTRDLLLVKNESLSKKEWRILCSSPRRQRNLLDFLNWALPQPAPSIRFENVRGNIPTRIRKLIQGDGEALVLAKAALDRLLGWKELESELDAEEKNDFATLEAELRGLLSQCRWMVMPLSQDPPAAAQGALAIEVSKAASPELLAHLRAINDESTFRDVTREREILASFGGGCHQAIGIWSRQIAEGRLESLRGKSDAGEVLNRWELQNQNLSEKREGSSFPQELPRDSLTESRKLSASIPSDRDLWVSKAQALPETFTPTSKRILWCAGLETWRKLAARGVWVHGSAESLGETLSPSLEALAGRAVDFLRLTHRAAAEQANTLATYEVVLKDPLPDLSRYRSFYWSSGSLFREMLQKFPSLKNAQHACGLGRTYQTLKEILPAANPPRAYLSFESWQRAQKG